MKPITGAWFEFKHHNLAEGQLYNDALRSFTAEQWAAMIRDMRAMGMDTLVLTCSSLVYREMHTALDGCFTVRDESLFMYLRMLDRACGIRIEPSACAGFAGLQYTAGHPGTHIVWSTGGGMVPPDEMEKYLI